MRVVFQEKKQDTLTDAVATFFTLIGAFFFARPLFLIATFLALTGAAFFAGAAFLAATFLTLIGAAFLAGAAFAAGAAFFFPNGFATAFVAGALPTARVANRGALNADADTKNKANTVATFILYMYLYGLFSDSKRLKMLEMMVLIERAVIVAKTLVVLLVAALVARSSRVAS